MALEILLHCITPSYRQMNKNMCKNAQSTNVNKDWSQLDFILIPVLNTHVNNNHDTILSKKNITEVLHILKFLPLPFQ